MLAQKLLEKKFVVTAEITPPKGAGIKKLLANAELLRPWADAINVTDCQRALVKMSSLAAARVLLDAGVEPVYQLTCRDRNSIALQSDLMGAYALGIRNVLCLTGDPVKAGDHPESKSVFEVETLGLLKLVETLQRGTDSVGHKMNARTQFYVGAVVNPTLKRGDGQLQRMRKKAEGGAQFFQTQANYDVDDLEAFLEATDVVERPVLPGILILSSSHIARFIHEEIPGIQIPESVLKRFATASDEEECGIDFAVETMLRLKNKCQGFHLMTVRREDLIPKVLERYYART